MDRDDLKFVLILSFVVVLFIGLSAGLTYIIGEETCSKTATMMQLPYKWTFWTDCMVEYNNNWIPLEYFRVVSK